LAHIFLSIQSNFEYFPFPQACDALLAQRVERKLHSKGLDKPGSGSVISRIFVAYPEPRDDKVRAPHIPEAALKKRAGSGKMEVDEEDEEDGDNVEEKKKPRRKFERELELEHGRDYKLDLRKHYLLKNEEEKYDRVPEIWEGHNIADFIDPRVVEVRNCEY
jgi:nucleolar GTP-binding protein